MDLEFTWVKPSLGYVWEDCESVVLHRGLVAPIGPFLVEKDYSQDVRSYAPLVDDALFARFGDLSSDAESFAQWASEFGMLTTGEDIGPSKLYVIPENSIEPSKPIHSSGFESNTKSGKTGFLQCTESLPFWQREHNFLGSTIFLWELVVDQDIERLGKLVKWQDTGTTLKVLGIRKDLFDAVDFEKIWNDESYGEADKYINRYRAQYGAYVTTTYVKEDERWSSPLFRSPEIIRPALYNIQRAIMAKLRTFPVNIDLRMDTNGQIYKILKPTSLLSAMWYQFSQVLVGELKIRRCSICQQWESMRGHRDTWRTHTKCASNKRVERFRKK
jgi:hypothetical protein